LAYAAAHPPIARVTVSNVQLTGVTPIVPAGALVEAPGQMLAQMSAGQKWISIDLTITATSDGLINFGYTSEGATDPIFAVNGKPLLSLPGSNFQAAGRSGIYVDVEGCPNPVTTMPNQVVGATTSGCVAVTVPATEQVRTVGIGISGTLNWNDVRYAQWKV
jgi:hypothetical protein